MASHRKDRDTRTASDPDEIAPEAADDEAFAAAMSDVAPLKVEKRIAGARSETPSAATLAARRAAAVEEKRIDPNPLTLGEVPLVGPHDEVAGKIAGVQEGVYRRLRLGQYPIDASLDLHRHTVREARSALWQFIQDCTRYDIRTVVVTHGKGERSEDPARLKRYVAHWLGQLPEVLAWHSAQRHHGGYGAVYVLLRKTEKRRQENAERHQKRHAGSPPRDRN